MEKEYVELTELLGFLREAVEGNFPERFWVKAEISSLSVKANGHCYLELCQSVDGVLKAKVRATAWRSRWVFIKEMFRTVTGSEMAVGMEILAKVQVVFHEVYGLSLNIEDVDPDFTLGAKEKKRQETIARLEKEGLFELQKRLRLTALPYSLAVISARGAAGLGDFRRHLLENEYGFVFDVSLYEATMQGDSAPSSIVEAFRTICSSGHLPDAVLVLRGGGSDLDLACFDDYEIAAAIARCPVPVFTAIGHDRDHHVADMVAYSSVKTPTALADVFLDCFISEDQRLSTYESRLLLAFNSRLSMMDSRVALLDERISRTALACIAAAEHKVDLAESTILARTGLLLSKAEMKLSAIEEKIAATDPRNVLRRGFVLPLDARGVRLSSARGSKPGDDVRMMFADGTLECKVEKVKEQEYVEGEI